MLCIITIMWLAVSIIGNFSLISFGHMNLNKTNDQIQNLFSVSGLSKALISWCLPFKNVITTLLQVQGQCKTGSSTFAHNFPQVYWYTKPSRYKPTLHVYKVIFINLITNKTKNKNMFLMQNKPLSCNCWSPIYRFMQKQNKKQFCIITEYILITESVVRTYQIWQLSQARVGDTE